MEDSEGRPIKLNGRFAEFSAADFTATNFATAQDKAQWANNFMKFILGGFQRHAFKKNVYRQLHHMLGHCAEYDLDGFYYTWFENTYKCLHWVAWAAAFSASPAVWNAAQNASPMI